MRIPRRAFLRIQFVRRAIGLHLNEGISVKKHLKRVSVLFFGLLFAASSALAANWREFVRLPGEVFYVNMEALTWDGMRFSIWELHDYDKTQSNAPGSRAKFKSRVDNAIGDCKIKSITTVKMYFYENNMVGGKVVHTLTGPYDPEEAPPGSSGRELVDQLCAIRPK